MDELERFVRAQQHSYAQALDEIRAGRKRGHWIWFVFPQLKGLGYSDMSSFMALRMRMRQGTIWRILCWERVCVRSLRHCWKQAWMTPSPLWAARMI